MIKVSSLNESYMVIDCERGLAREISEYFTFSVPGHQFTPQFKEKLWDGKIRLFDLRTMCLYRGLLEYLKIFCNQREYKLEIDSDLELTVNLSLKEGLDFAKTLNLPFEPRDYQIESFVHAIRNKRMLILSPTASGKSLIIYLILRYLQHKGLKKGLLIVPTTSLVEQMYSDFKNYGYDVDANCHRVYAGKERMSDVFLTISTWQSLYTQESDFFHDFEFVFGDECHLFKAKSLSTIMAQSENAGYRIGLTGTLDGTQTHKTVLEGLFGPVYKTVTTKELIDTKKLAAFQIKCLTLKYSNEICSQSNKWDYQEEINFLVSNESRNKFIKNLALSLKGNTLILFNLIDKHGKVLYNMIKESVKDDRHIFFIYGDTEVKDREDARRITDSYPLQNEILFEFDDIKIKCKYGDNVTLTDGSTKKAEFITENDDIDASWILKNIQLE